MSRARFAPALTLVALACACAPATAAEPRPPFAWNDGDRVVLIGDTFVERDQSHGYFETIVTARDPGKSVTFRNLGWSGDTVFGHARAGFDKPADGFRRLKEHVRALKPTVLIVGYGMADSFAGGRGLPAFTDGFNALLDAVDAGSTRLVLLSPVAHENLGKPLPDPAGHNADLARYRDAVKATAERRNAWFVDLYEPTLSAHDYGIDPLTDNGIHPTAYGHWYLAGVIDLELRQDNRGDNWDVRVDAGRKTARGTRTKIDGLEASATGVRFRATDETLPPPPASPGAPEAVVWLGGRRSVRVNGLGPGSYTLKIDGKTVARADAGNWSKGLPIAEGPEFDQVEALRRAIVEKNQLYFYRWRPQNETYLFGFRKHEQGNNAREIPLFDPLVTAKEAEIARLRVPAAHQYELTRDAEAAD